MGFCQKDSFVKSHLSKHGCLTTNVEELSKLLKWAHVPKSCDNNNPKPLSYFSLAGISVVDKSSLSS